MKKTNHNGCRELTLRQTARFLKKHDAFIILTHTSPDGDTLGSAYALYYGLKEIGKTACVLCSDVIPKKYGYFVRKTDHIKRENNTVITVDVADKHLLGALKEEFGDQVDLSIDHHISNTRFAKNLLLDADAAATAETVFELLKVMKVNINTITAKALYTGIVTDTGCFKYTNVTAKTHRIAAQLYDFDLNAAEINRIMFDTKSRKLLELERKVLDAAEFYFNDKCIVLPVTAQMQKETGCSGSDLESIAVISRCVEGIKAGITIKQTGDEEYKISLRTFDPLNASEICKKVGGGGHKAAAGATLKGSLEEVKAVILDAVKEAMEESNAGTSAAE